MCRQNFWDFFLIRIIYFHFYFLLLYFSSVLNLAWMSHTEFSIASTRLKVGHPVGHKWRQGCFSFLSTDRRHLFLQCAVVWSILARVATYMFCMKTSGRARFLHKRSREAIESVEGLSKGLWWKNVSSLWENTLCWRKAERVADIRRVQEEIVVLSYLLSCWWCADVRLAGLKQFMLNNPVKLLMSLKCWRRNSHAGRDEWDKE